VLFKHRCPEGVHTYDSYYIIKHVIFNVSALPVSTKVIWVTSHGSQIVPKPHKNFGENELMQFLKRGK
jgi:hypothetical protein